MLIWFVGTAGQGWKSPSVKLKNSINASLNATLEISKTCDPWSVGTTCLSPYILLSCLWVILVALISVCLYLEQHGDYPAILRYVQEKSYRSWKYSHAAVVCITIKYDAEG